MKGDFSQLVVGPGRYSGVLMQQGRAMIDADWNELLGILTSAQRRAMADLVGPHGGPADRLGFALATAETEGHGDLEIGAGGYYVDGIRVDVEAADDGKPALYSSQAFLTEEEQKEFPSPPYLAYLDLWERHVTALEDGSIREVALGGPDTTSRSEVIWQVKVLTNLGDLAVGRCLDFSTSALRERLIGSRPRMKARARRPDVVADDPCVASPDARFRGLENQLYRVEVHSVQGAEITFVWSRENGSVVAAWLATDGDDLRVTGVRDKVHGFQAGDWVELIYDQLELREEHGVLVRLAAVDGETLTMDATTASGTIEADPSRLAHPKVRRWDQKEHGATTLRGGAVPVVTGTSGADWIPLEDGIEVQFQPPSGAADDWRVGDHWVFPARVATGDIIWPHDADGTARALSPHGVDHHYAPLGIISERGAALTDLRRQFAPLAVCLSD